MTYDARYEKLFADYAEGKSAPYGVTVEALAAYRVCSVKELTQEDLLDVSKDEARRVHHSVVWQWQELYRMPDAVAKVLFPKLIEAGDATPIRELQEVLKLPATGRIDADFARRVKAGDPVKTASLFKSYKSRKETDDEGRSPKASHKSQVSRNR